jgi:aryl-alcohol dehydrogenase-like predicted oxidoreductase
VDVEAYKATLRRAYELGVTVFDAAEAYGDAEGILGEVVRPFRDDVVVATKVGVREGLEPNLSAAYVTEACEASLRRLGMARIDLYQVHFDDPDTPVGETVAALEGLIRSGKIRRYGVGHLPLPRVVQYMEDGDVFSVLMEFSAVARGAREQLLPLCEEREVAAIGFSVTGRGLLTGRYTEDHAFPDGDIRQIDPLFQRERFRSGLRVAEKLAAIGARYGKTPAQTAIAWVLAQPGITCALTGPSSIDHLEENLAASGWTIPDEELADLDAWLDRERRRLARAQRTSGNPCRRTPSGRSGTWST